MLILFLSLKCHNLNKIKFNFKKINNHKMIIITNLVKEDNNKVKMKFNNNNNKFKNKIKDNQNLKKIDLQQ